MKKCIIWTTTIFLIVSKRSLFLAPNGKFIMWIWSIHLSVKQYSNQDFLIWYHIPFFLFSASTWTNSTSSSPSADYHQPKRQHPSNSRDSSDSSLWFHWNYPFIIISQYYRNNGKKSTFIFFVKYTFLSIAVSFQRTWIE